MALPVYGEAYSFNMALAKSGAFVIDPVIEAGDFQISKDGGAFANLSILPVVTPAGSFNVKVSLTATEGEASKISIQARDPGLTWDDVLIFIDNPDGSTETLLDIEEGDRIENTTSLRINLKGTTTPLIDKEITGSLLPLGNEISTKDAP